MGEAFTKMWATLKIRIFNFRCLLKRKLHKIQKHTEIYSRSDSSSVTVHGVKQVSLILQHFHFPDWPYPLECSTMMHVFYICAGQYGSY